MIVYFLTHTFCDHIWWKALFKHAPVSKLHGFKFNICFFKHLSMRSCAKWQNFVPGLFMLGVLLPESTKFRMVIFIICLSRADYLIFRTKFFILFSFKEPLTKMFLSGHAPDVQTVLLARLPPKPHPCQKTEPDHLLPWQIPFHVSRQALSCLL